VLSFLSLLLRGPRLFGYCVLELPLTLFCVRVVYREGNSGSARGFFGLFVCLPGVLFGI